MVRVIFYFLGTVYTLYLGILYGSSSLLMVFFIELLLPFLTLLSAIWVAYHTEVELKLPMMLTEQGKSVPVYIFLKKHTWMPAGQVCVQVREHRPISRKPEKIRFFGRMAKENYRKGKYVWNLKYDASCIGTVAMEIGRVWCYDLLGLYAIPIPKRFWKKLKGESLLVMPAITPVPVTVCHQSRNFAGESDIFSKEKAGDDASEIFRIRDYQEGDKLRSIHWKLSAKAQELMVREKAFPLGCPVVFYLNLYQEMGSRERRDCIQKKRDSLFQILASVSMGMVQEGCRHYVIWYDEQRKDIIRYRIEREEEVYELLIQLGRMKSYYQKQDLEELYRQKYHELQYVTKLELDRELNMRVNGQKLCQYEREWQKLEGQLSEQELVV